MAPLGPFGMAPRIVAGVSGGPHSLALALLLAEWLAERRGTLTAGIVDHGLRPESAAEAATVARWLESRGIACRILSLDMSPGPAMQARARDGRLAALLALAAAQGVGWVALGQHRADQAETLLLRALAGSGATGLAGMAPARNAGGALLIRPLLAASPAWLEAVVASAGLVPVRDPSNADPRFTRARLRAALADAAGEGPATAALAEAAGAFAGRRAVRQAAVAARLARAAMLSEHGFARLDLAALGQDAVAVAALGGLLRAIGGGLHAPAPAAVAGLLARRAGTLGGARLTRQGLLLREDAAMAPPVPATDGVAWDGRFRLSGTPGPGLMLGALGAAAARLERPAGLPAAVARTLPALWLPPADGRDTVLVAVPALSYPAPETSFGIRVRFAPPGGAVG
ncbi:tRNA lysidine(34) synthetase TilS [Roseomonas frigidaquae]|uniref:tRNA(Ile)-lysidine synthase n=1 Tax=Falsiroseomonas frigidaquae TaxID=487318 RepID=A0ABX1F948_9PROT|nr:tRNA lysidine(34) synthetase TilS [Falsiroseomonas frigidaquae]NKE48754.1 tRNA lysidine(34) synthetase TilS [Falsiroseomonas frigidaquae]